MIRLERESNSTAVIVSISLYFELLMKMLTQSLDLRSWRYCRLIATVVTVVALLCIWACKGENKSESESKGGSSEQDPTGLDPIYALDLMPELHFSLDEKAVEKLKKKPRKYVRATLRYNGTQYTDVAIRLKGHRSMRKLDDKPALKARFDKYNDDGRFLGQRELTLNNMVEDPTMVREVLGYRLYREAGVSAPHAGYATVTINGEPKGLYAVIETIDTLFLARRFDDSGGNLYEGEYGCDLYPDDVPGFDHDEGPGGDEREDLAAFARAASGADEALFGSQSPLDMPSFLSYLAVSALIGDFDGYRHSHNYRIYHEPTKDKWYFVPWGIDRVFKKNNSIYDSQGLLAKRCFGHAPCRLEYLRTMRRVIDHFAKLNLDQGLVVVGSFIDKAARADSKKPYTDDKTGIYRSRLLRYLNERTETVEKELACLDGNGNEIDRDGDGYGCMDCNDKVPEIHPGAKETCNNIDNDCSGLADDAAACPCPSHDIGGQIFYFCDLAMTWAEAADHCAAQNLELARIESVEQSKAVYKQARKYNKERWWIGLSDRAKEDRFVWRDGSPGEFTFWARGEPDNDACNQDCVAIKEGGKGRWHDTHCGQMRPFLCRAPKAPAPNGAPLGPASSAEPKRPAPSADAK